MRTIELKINQNSLLKKSENEDKNKSIKYSSKDFIDFRGESETDFIRFLIKKGIKDFSNIFIFEEINLSNLEIDNCRFTNCDFRSIDFSNSVLKNCDFSLTDILSGTNFQNAKLENIKFQNCRIFCDFKNVALFQNIDLSANYISFNFIENTFVNNSEMLENLQKIENGKMKIKFNENTCFALNFYMSTYYSKSKKEFFIYLREAESKKITNTIDYWEKFLIDKKQSNCLPKPATQSYQDLKKNFHVIKEKITFLEKLL